MKKLKYWVFAIVLCTFFSCKKEEDRPFTKLEGYAFGTGFHLVYDDEDDVTQQIDSLFNLINASLSTYMLNSDISKINNGDTAVVVDQYFEEVFNKSARIYKETEGIFDPTIGTLVNAWDFGPEKAIKNPDSLRVKALLERVGFDKVHLRNGKVIKAHDSIYIDFNAIAKGYAVDVVGRFLESKNVQNYLVEIGGEIRTRGVKQHNEPWKAGIEDPNFDGTRSIQKVIELKNEAMATSGSYRKFKVDSITGQKYVHIINPKTGYPTQSRLLSVSVISTLDCADVDGYATALMAMSLEKAKAFLEKHSALKGYLIYIDDDGQIQTFASENF